MPKQSKIMLGSVLMVVASLIHAQDADPAYNAPAASPETDKNGITPSLSPTEKQPDQTSNALKKEKSQTREEYRAKKKAVREEYRAKKKAAKEEYRAKKKAEKAESGAKKQDVESNP